MTRLSRAADRLSTGSRLHARRLAARAAAWCARGRRDDLTGWRAALGIIVRLALLALGAYLLARLVRALPSLMWLLTGWWTIAAWRAGRPAAQAPQKEPEEAPAAPDVEVVRTLLLDLMGTGSGVHLRTVLAHLQEHGQWEGRTVTDLRAHLARLQVPHDARVKVGGVPTWGVRRRDLEAPSPASTKAASTEASTAA
ncbi:hypothetical protein PV516_01210 [Streptomyces scabiei]|uniref:hypothetical protein n=1 Tax=Streptomyces scabiei TaxID=1930 RepID=UPI0029A2F985|nr:hypothetical protein [Streptomyces scabiei]MDX3162419.1 hypothetical protein [Streptomyces scabiei]